MPITWQGAWEQSIGRRAKPTEARIPDLGNPFLLLPTQGILQVFDVGYSACCYHVDAKLLQD